MKKAVVFDVGGVLAHDVWEHFFCDKDGISEKYCLDRGQLDAVGRLLWEVFAYRRATQPGDPDKFEKEYWNYFIKAFELEECARDDLMNRSHKFIRPVEGMDRLLAKLEQQHVDLLLCSNNNEFWFKRQMDLGFHKFFQDENKVILSCRIGVSKSDDSGKMFCAVRDALNGDVKDCIFVDDRGKNIKCAVGHGMTGILFPRDAEYGARYLEFLLRKMGFLM